ncbi:hypothetical protein FD723_29315 [Nostoc sp. C052]|uniref:hypothetical protein n=1 Tax=Nostoc sp. C052 TaxID=2576902 RepID=UPI0015C38DCA|nr:hypothetical protein [Nostoc sp. C052]QLE44135.1 hypothetical protein FD723_29315 [Nostoc sp. C052]
MLQKNCSGGFAKANILICVGLRSASPNLRLMHYSKLAMPLEAENEDKNTELGFLLKVDTNGQLYGSIS